MPPPKVFVKRSDANKIDLEKGTLGALLTKKGLQDRLDDVGLYNWGTKEKREINRALIELHGCYEIDEADPLKSKLDPAFAVQKHIHEPKLWKPEPALELEKTHTIDVVRRRPAPAVGITDLKRWFKIGTDDCEAKYVLEGLVARASKVDFEVHATGYHKLELSNPQNNAHPRELVETPCDTQDDKGSTHVFQKIAHKTVGGKRPPTDAQAAPAWKGESEAKHGIYEKTASPNVGSLCAPYNVLVRYYKDDADKAVKVLLLPFNPTWKHAAGAPLDDASLVVRWEIKGDAKKKLKRGQLLIHDKDGKVVFFAALDATELQGGKDDRYSYDLLKHARRKWDKAEIKRDKMPYCAQIQAHSDEAEEDGLALAVRPTLVRGFEYKKIQFVAFDVKPGVHAGAYVGHADHDTDIKERCDAMKDAITLAAPHVDKSADVLKLFMAPEFYFRGQKGGYPVEKLSSIMHAMRQETDKLAYMDWLFVFGTAIGYHLHEDPTSKAPISHTGDAKIDAEITLVDTDVVDAEITLVDDVDVTDTKVTVRCARTPTTSWKVKHGLVTAPIKAVAGGGAVDLHALTLTGKHVMAQGAVTLLEPLVGVVDTKVTVKSVRAPTKDWKVNQKLVTAPIKTVTPGGAANLHVLTLNGTHVLTPGAIFLLEPLVWIEAATNGTKTKVNVDSVVAPAIGWKLKDSLGVEDVVDACTTISAGKYELTMKGCKSFAISWAVLTDLLAVEHGRLVNVTVTNVDNTDPTDTKLTLQSPVAPTTVGFFSQGMVFTGIKAVAPGMGVNVYDVTLNGKHVVAAAPATFIESVSVASQVVGTKTEATVVSSVCTRIIPSGITGEARWKITDSAAVTETIDVCTSLGAGKYRLTMEGPGALTTGLGTLVEPKTTEVFNAALVQHGWPTPHVGAEQELQDSKGGAIRARTPQSALIYKEAISWIDFIGPYNGRPQFRAVDGSGRIIYIHDPSNRIAIPTSGSKDTLGANPNRGSEINKTGFGGGGVLTIDDICFGVEVCLDHNDSRLGGFYAGTAKAVGDPKVQVHLIPSWGSSIGGGTVCAPDVTGLVFNVDGQKRHSVARIRDAELYCDNHPRKHSGAPGACDVLYEEYYCGTCNEWRLTAGNCPHGGHAVTTYHKCAHIKVTFSPSCTLCGNALPCGAHALNPGAPRPAVQCSNKACNKLRWAPGAWPPTCGSCGAVRPPTAATMVSACSTCNGVFPCVTHAAAHAWHWMELTCPACTNKYRLVPPGLAGVCWSCGTNALPAYCERLYSPPGKCPDHMGLAPQRWQCVTAYAPLGTLLATTHGPTSVPKTKNTTYFDDEGFINVYEVKDIPPPDFV